MNKLLIPALVAAAVSAAALPAAAQSHGPQSYGQSYGHQDPRNQHGPAANAGYGNWQSISVRTSNLDRRIDQGQRNGALSRREAVRLRTDLNSLVRLETSYRRGGLTNWERADLDRRFDRLSAQVRIERRDNDNRRG